MRDVVARLKRLAAPRSLKTSRVGPAAVTLKWAAPKGAAPAYYVVFRDGKSLGKTTRKSYTDSKVKPGKVYRYTVRAYDKRKRAGAPTASVRVKVPAAASPPTAPAPVAPTPPPPAAPDPTPPAPPRATLSTAMVDRLFWRAGFGPAQADRDAWTGRPVEDLIDWFLSTPAALAPTSTPPKAASGAAIDPRVSDDELVLEWVDRMQRAVNPLPERLAFFWHRHWAVSRDDGTVSFDWALRYRDRLLRFADPATTFRALAYEITTVDPAMSAYLNLNANTRTRPNENYARELMELFCLGPNAPDGTPNYSQADIEGLTRALTGWRLDASATLGDGVTPNPNYGRITFAPNQFETGAKTFLGRTIAAVTGSTNTTTNPASLSWGPSAVGQAIDIVLAHPQHAPFLVRKLWGEFVAAPIPEATLEELCSAYRASGFQLRPLLRGILTHPLIFESLDEPNLVKPPIVYAVGVLRALERAAAGRHRAHRPGEHAAAAVPSAERRRLGGRDVVAEHQHGDGPLRHGRQSPVPEVLQLLLGCHQLPARRRFRGGGGGLRARLCVRRPAVAGGGNALGADRLGADGGDEHRHGAPAALLRAAGHDPRRTRRAGDVTMRCIECEEIELARVRDERPAEALPIPYAALDGFPAGRSAADLTRRRLLQWGVAGFASIYGAQALGFEQVWESVAHAQTAPEQKTLVVLYLAGGNDGLNVLVPTQAADYSAYTAARPSIHRAQGASTADRVGSTVLPGSGGGALAFANVVVSKDGGGDNSAARFGFTGTGGDGFGFDALYGDGSGGAGSDLAVMPAVDAKQYNLSHFDNSDIWFRASNDVNIKTGWLGRWLERYGSDTNPLQAISIDTALSKAIRTSAKPVCAIPSLPMGGFTMNSSNYGGSNNYSVNPRMRDLARLAERQRVPAAVALDVRSRRRDLPAHRQRRLGRRQRDLPEHLDAVDAAADGRASAGGEPGHADHHDPLGLVRHPHRPARRPRSPARGALAGAGRLQGRPDGARDRAERLHARVLGVRPPRARERRGGHGGHGPRRGRPDAGDGLRRARRLRGRLAGLRDDRARAGQRQPGQPEGPDGLPLGLQGRGRGVARRRPRRRAGRPAGRDRWSAATG